MKDEKIILEGISDTWFDYVVEVTWAEDTL